ncbi:hypothetical protein KOR42_05610 [Thalassoglobus neptunius]|uniref:Uncharacterized protein n=1 Tax=Thalassoglobus neptunius TaxID=1938619 RepID=A0A5C5X4Q1_9PLAN|nr:hypothetical protein KOR42_05610 [Thalassoglobus neptunius]
MCFNHDECEWIADEADDSITEVDASCCCWDCGVRIPEGCDYRRIHLTKCCVECGEMEPTEECLEEGGHESYEDTVQICLICNDLRSAVIEVEESEGCRGNEVEPSYGALEDAFVKYWNEPIQYADAVVKKFPHLRHHPWINDDSFDPIELGI